MQALQSMLQGPKQLTRQDLGIRTVITSEACKQCEAEEPFLQERHGLILVLGFPDYHWRDPRLL